MDKISSLFTRNKSPDPLSGDSQRLLSDDDDDSLDIEMQESNGHGPPFKPTAPAKLTHHAQSLTRRWWALTAGGTLFILTFGTILYAATREAPILAPIIENMSDFDPVKQLLERQSQTLEEARARYSLKNDGRDPPPHYDDWFAFARERKCLIDDYDQIYADFKPFYQLAEVDPTFFERALNKTIKSSGMTGRSLRTYEIKKGEVKSVAGGNTLYEGDWPRTFQRFSKFLPNMRFVLNGQDEPRVLFDVHRPNAREKALELSDNNAFMHNPRPTSDFFKEEGRCLFANSKTGFGDLANDHNAFLLNSATSQMTTDLLPVLSATRISPCFADILVPSEYYYSDSGHSAKYKHPDTTLWKDKLSKTYWRGSTSGGMIEGDNYHEFQRFKIIDIARNHSDIIDAGLTAMSTWANCRNPSKCNSAAISKEYNITQLHQKPPEESYKYKYLFDVDGNSFSGRYLGLMRTGSLVLKSTVFSEFFNSWLRPFEHYIPVLPDLSDLVEKIHWAISHDAEAERIQAVGRKVAEKIMTDGQNDCYFFAVLLEYGRLQNLEKEESEKTIL